MDDKNQIDFILSLYSNGKAHEALNELDSIIKNNPNDPLLFNIKGACYAQLGEPIIAIKHYEKAIEIDPNYPEAHNNLGIILQELGELDKALISFEKAFSLKPEKVETANIISSILTEINNPNTSIDYFKKILESSPDLYIAYFNLGVAYQELGLTDKAISSYKKTLGLNSDFTNAYLNLGLLLEDSEKHEDAKNNLERALEIDPNNTVILNNLGITLNSLERVDEAISCFKRAINIAPNDLLGHFNLGMALKSSHKIDDAINSFKKVIEIDPNSSESYYFLGELYRLTKQFNAALVSLEKAFSLNPDIDFLIGALLNTKMNLALWDGIEDYLKILTKKINTNEKAVTPFALMALIDDPQLQYKASQVYAEYDFPQSSLSIALKPYTNHKKIRVGYFSADYHNHPTMHLMAELFELHDRKKFEIFAFSFGPNQQDKWRQRASLSFDKFIDVRLKSDSEISALSREMEIDIAVNLGGYTHSTRTGVFVNFAAPIQVNFLVYPGTMGSKYFDYIVADHTLISPENKDYFSEKIVYMPDSYQSNISEREVSNKTILRSELELPENAFVFSCFNNIHKITPPTFESWMRILNSVDHSVLWLYANDESVISNILETASRFGVDRNRIIFASHAPVEQHLNRIRKADLFLDTLPYNAHTTASDALRMGVPVITLIGKSFASRVAASLLNAVNMPELITNTREQYESLATDLALDTEKLRIVKSKLINNLPKTALFNCQTFTKNLELAFAKMHQRSQSGLQPDHIIVRELQDT